MSHSMQHPEVVIERARALSEALGTSLKIVQSWENEYRPGWYFRFRGTLHDSPFLRAEVAGTDSVELTPGREDEVDLFVFVNCQRVGPKSAPFRYLTRRGSRPFAWDDLDSGYEEFDSLDVAPWNFAPPQT